VMCGSLQVMCSLGRPIQSDVRSSQGDVWYCYAHKLVMCGFQADPLRTGGSADIITCKMWMVTANVFCGCNG